MIHFVFALYFIVAKKDFSAILNFLSLFLAIAISFLSTFNQGITEWIVTNYFQDKNIKSNERIYEGHYEIVTGEKADQTLAEYNYRNGSIQALTQKQEKIVNYIKVCVVIVIGILLFFLK